jgi:hypothetical protein
MEAVIANFSVAVKVFFATPTRVTNNADTA